MGWMWFFWGFLILLLVLLFQRTTGSPRTPPSETQASAEEILKRRYARGEIGKEEYEFKLEGLRR